MLPGDSRGHREALRARGLSRAVTDLETRLPRPERALEELAGTERQFVGAQPTTSQALGREGGQNVVALETALARENVDFATDLARRKLDLEDVLDTEFGKLQPGSVPISAVIERAEGDVARLQNRAEVLEKRTSDLEGRLRKRFEELIDDELGADFLEADCLRCEAQLVAHEHLAQAHPGEPPEGWARQQEKEIA